MSSRAQTEDYYDSFSAAVGLRDWALPNARHIRIQEALSRAVSTSSNLRIFDLGCGAGVLSNHLTQFGSVTGTDLSGPAIELARTLVPEALFHNTRLEDLEDGPFDLVTMFDVLEHVPRDEWPSLFEQVDRRLVPGAKLFLSSPRPGYTRWMRAERPDLEQVIEEEVDLDDVRSVVEPLGLTLAAYETYDIEHSGQYHAMTFVSHPGPAGEPALPEGARTDTPWSRATRVARRVPLAWRLLRAGQPRVAFDLFAARIPTIRPASMGSSTPADHHG